MKDHFNPMLDPLGATWAETIAALPTQEERDEAMHFVEHDLRKGAGNGILRGMFLLLKANRCYLEKLPEKFNSEMVKPLIENLRRIEARIALHSDMQDKMQTQMERSVSSATNAADRMEAVVPRMAGIVQEAFDNIDSSKLTQKIEETVTEGVVKPVAKVNAKCDQLQDKLEKRAAVLTPLFRWGTLTNLAISVLSCAMLVASIGIIVTDNMKHDMTSQLQDRIAQEIQNVHANAATNEETLGTLAKLNVAIVINPEKDWLGNIVPDHYCLAIKDADNASIVHVDGQQYGAIFFKEQATDLHLYPDQ